MYLKYQHVRAFQSFHNLKKRNFETLYKNIGEGDVPWWCMYQEVTLMEQSF